MTAPTRMKISDSGAAAACQRVMRSTMTYGKMLKASPKNARTKMPTDPVNGTHAQASSARGWCRSVTPTITNSTAVISGTGASSTMLGNENHLWNTKLLTSGVATEMAAMPAAASHRLRRAQATARRCSSPSVFMSGQHDRHRQVKLAEDDAVRDWKRRQQQADAEHQPGLVGVPERSDRFDHHVLLTFVGE